MAVWNPRANAIFASLLELPQPQRQVALEQACGADCELRQQVEALLVAHAQAGSFLDWPAVGAASPGELDLPPTGPDSGPPLQAEGSVVRALGAASRVHLRDPGDEVPTPVVRPVSDSRPSGHDLTGRLQLHGEIARGGMGAVLKGRDTDLGRDIAVKVLLETHQGKTELVQRFVDEAQIAGQLQHPGIAPVYQLSQFADKRPYFTMKLVKGKTLAALMAARKEPAEEQSRYVGIFAQVCQTLAYAHARGVIHRDLKPSNVMVGAFGEVQVMDWGLAKVLRQGGVADEEKAQTHPTVSVIRTQRSTGSGAPEFGSQTQAGSVLGTPAYMAPEQARGDVELVDERADVFGLGAILCEVLTGQPPYTGKRPEVLRKAQTASLEDAYAGLDGCGADGELIDLAKGCLTMEPWERPRDAGQVAEAVAAYQNSVAERLRQAELSHAAEVARAEEARVTAEQERRARHEAQARAAAERRALRMAMGLAASVLLTVLLGGGGWLWLAWDREARERAVLAQQVKTTRDVHEALTMAQSLGEWARAGQGAARWAEARAMAKRAEALVESGPVEPELAEQVQTLLRQLAEEERDQQLLAALDAARLAEAETDVDSNKGFASERAIPLFREALRAYGMPVGQGEAGEVAARIRQLPAAVREALLAALDEWIRLAKDREYPIEEPHLDWLEAVVAAADSGGWRKELRTALAEKDVVKRREALEKLADAADVSQLPPQALTQLARQLQDVWATASALRLLRRAQQQHPQDFWLNYKLGWALMWQVPPEAVRYLTAAVALRPDSPMIMHSLTGALTLQGKLDEATATCHRVLALDPKYGLAYNGLGAILTRQGKPNEALAAYRKAAELDPNCAPAHQNMGSRLMALGKVDEAIAAFRQAVAIDPKYVFALRNLGKALRTQGKAEEAISTFRQALTINPEDEDSNTQLRTTLRDQGRTDEAITFFRTASQVLPDNIAAHINLGLALYEMDQLDEAIAELREAIRIRPNVSGYHVSLGIVLRRQGKIDEAVAEFREAIRLSRNNVTAHNNLGFALQDAGKWDEAIAAFRQAILISPNNASARSSVLRLEKVAKLEPKLPAILEGQEKPANAAECIELGWLCQRPYKQFYAASARFYREAFEANPELARNATFSNRYNAACAAALAGAGKGKDDPVPDDAARAKLRQQAHDWLQADLTALAERLNSNNAQAWSQAQSRLQLFKADPDLLGVRDSAALAQLPAEEREAWQRLWAEVETLLRKAGPKK
jgi:serine/threonine-protein kinase